MDLLARRGDAAGPRDRAAAARVRAARIPHAQRRPRRLEDDDPVARVGLQLRSRAPTSWTCSSTACARRSTGTSSPSCCTRGAASATCCRPSAGDAADDARAAPGRVAQTLGFRLAFWYAAIFTVSVAGHRRHRLCAACPVARPARPRSDPRQARRLRGALRKRRRRPASAARSPPSRRRAARTRCSCGWSGSNAEVLLTSMPASWGSYALEQLGGGEGWRIVPARGRAGAARGGHRAPVGRHAPAGRPHHARTRAVPARRARVA